MAEKENNLFLIKRKDIIWSAKNFTLAILIAFVFSMLMYSITMMFSEPTYVDEAIVSTASAAVAKVEVTSDYINPMWSVFLFNSIAIFSVVIGTALFLFIHPMMIGEIELRSKHRIYANVSIAMEKILMPFIRLIQRLVAFKDSGFPSTAAEKEEISSGSHSMWQYCGYGKSDYHKFAYMLPYTVPVMILLVNGFLLGILLAFFIFNGAITGFEIFGTKGILIGIVYNLIYFFISIIPHGIIELPAILVATALGYRFALVQSHEVKDQKLFLADNIETAKRDVARILDITKDYLASLYVWKIIALMVAMLLLASYIEIYVTLGIAETVMQTLDNIIETGLS